MTFLVDANVISEGTKPDPDEGAVKWLRRNEHLICVNPFILGEIRFGILLLPAGKRRQRLERWFMDGVVSIQCLPWDTDIGLRWAELLADLRARGRSISIKDSMIAATALTHDLTVATRNVQDFKKTGVRVVDPFE